MSRSRNSPRSASARPMARPPSHAGVTRSPRSLTSSSLRPAWNSPAGSTSQCGQLSIGVPAGPPGVSNWTPGFSSEPFSRNSAVITTRCTSSTSGSAGASARSKVKRSQCVCKPACGLWSKTSGTRAAAQPATGVSEPADTAHSASVSRSVAKEPGAAAAPIGAQISRAQTQRTPQRVSRRRNPRSFAFVRTIPAVCRYLSPLTSVKGDRFGICRRPCPRACGAGCSLQVAASERPARE